MTLSAQCSLIRSVPACCSLHPCDNLTDLGWSFMVSAEAIGCDCEVLLLRLRGFAVHLDRALSDIAVRVQAQRSRAVHFRVTAVFKVDQYLRTELWARSRTPPGLRLCQREEGGFSERR
jgi:hypothetical protein